MTLGVVEYGSRSRTEDLWRWTLRTHPGSSSGGVITLNRNALLDRFYEPEAVIQYIIDLVVDQLNRYAVPVP
jgi:hypothetical protein